MTMKLFGMMIGASALAFSGYANAQETEQTSLPPVEDAAQTDDATSGEGEEAVSEDDMADFLNAQQELQQTFRLERRINGVVIETEERTVTLPRDEPYWETEAGQTTLEKVKAAFDGELLTRSEAFDEAQLDFTIADVNHDGGMTQDEFAALVESWQDKAKREPGDSRKATARQRQYDAFLAQITGDASEPAYEAYAREKFAFMAGASPTLSRQEYVTEYLIDFYAMDEDKDMILKGEELMRFRALNRGEKLD